MLALFFCASAFSQGDREDVIYMKNGSIYRGTIIEQVPSVSYKIEIAGGSVIVAQAGEVTKITKEPKTSAATEYIYKDVRVRRPLPDYQFRPKGYFFQGQVLLEALEFGFRIVNGYKFGQFGYLGLGVGVDGVILDIHGSTDYAGAYFPIFVHYGGDILKTQITPFYSVEAGYAFHPAPSPLSPANIYGSGSDVVTASGGFMAGAGFGVRFKSRRKVHFDLSAHVDFKQSFATINTESTYGYGYEYSEHTILIIPGIRFGVGF